MTAYHLDLCSSTNRLPADQAFLFASQFGKDLPERYATTTLATTVEGISLCLTCGGRGVYHLSIEGPDGLVMEPSARRLLELFDVTMTVRPESSASATKEASE